jgi:chromosome segregation ATPase
VTTQADCLVSAADAYAKVCQLSSPALQTIAEKDAQIGTLQGQLAASQTQNGALQDQVVALQGQLTTANATISTQAAKLAQADADADAAVLAAQKVANDL